jgi:hypothetical protein
VGSAGGALIKHLNKNHGAIKLPKIGWVHFRGYRPLGGKLLSVTFRLKAGRRPVFFSLTFLSPKPALVIPVRLGRAYLDAA